jgi:SsrA-binding protein
MSTTVIKNKKATFEFELLEKVVAGIVLTGTEIKSIRAGTANLKESYCYFKKGELYIKNMHIAEYKHGNIYNHDPYRERKLLLKKRELKKLHNKVKTRGLTIVPVKLFIASSGYAKIEVALAKGKKVYDKRASLKEKELKREVDRAHKYS